MDAPQDQIEVSDVPANWVASSSITRVKDFTTGKLVPLENAHAGVITWLEYSSMAGPGATPGVDHTARGFRVVVMYRGAPAAEHQKVMWTIIGNTLPKKPKALSIYQLQWLVANFDGVLDQMRKCHEFCAQLGAKQTGVASTFALKVYAPDVTDTTSVEEMDVPVLVNDKGEVLPYCDHLAFAKAPLYRDYAMIRGTPRFVGNFCEEKRGEDTTRIQVVISQKLAPEAWYRNVSILFRDGATIGKPCAFDIVAAYWFQSMGETIIQQAEEASQQLRTLGICQRNPDMTWEGALKF